MLGTIDTWMREWGDVTFGTSGFSQWNNNLLTLTSTSPDPSVKLLGGLVDFSFEVLLEDEATGITWPPNALGDIQVLAGMAWSPLGTSGPPDLKVVRGADLLVTGKLTMTQQWEFTNASTGGHARIGLWETTESLRFHVERNIVAPLTAGVVNVGVLPYFAGAVSDEGFVFGARARSYSRLLWKALL